ncbi:MAG TPA: hypothetical protein VEG60_15505, partial [Candidatus Binatia bacterium]|nr:hypothetical protein [Candidatus Binatia bacterium]
GRLLTVGPRSWTKKVMNQKFGWLVKLVIGLALLIGASGTALGEEFYKGKTILFIVVSLLGEVTILTPEPSLAILADTFPETPRP